jgi:hypothetical protein
MPTNYTTNDVGAQSVVREISDTEDFNGDKSSEIASNYYHM